MTTLTRFYNNLVTGNVAVTHCVESTKLLYAGPG